MAPLPCSPVSNSTASEQSHHTSEDSDDSLNTPRPGPLDPSLRTQDTLSRPSVPIYSSSLDSRKRQSPSRSTTGTSNSRDYEQIPWDRSNEAPPPQQQPDGQRRVPYTYGTSPKGSASGPLQVLERRRSVTFSPHSSQPKPERQSSYAHISTSHKLGSNVGPRGESRAPDDVGDSSADESAAIFPRERFAGGRSGASYGAMAGDPHDESNMQATGYEGGEEELGSDGPKKRKTSAMAKAKQDRGRTQPEARTEATEEDLAHAETWWRALVEKYGGVELENKGSVARDHLALERTFLAWLRTALSFASIGIAVTQLFRLNASLKTANKRDIESTLVSPSQTSPSLSEQPLLAIAASQPLDKQKLSQLGKPLGATFLGISILILFIGLHRYFESQHYVIRGKFPASRGSIILVFLVALVLIIVSLVVVIAVAPTAFGTT